MSNVLTSGVERVLTNGGIANSEYHNNMSIMLAKVYLARSWLRRDACRGCRTCEIVGTHTL